MVVAAGTTEVKNQSGKKQLSLKGVREKLLPVWEHQCTFPEDENVNTGLYFLVKQT